jgi:hypothetical protein
MGGNISKLTTNNKQQTTKNIMIAYPNNPQINDTYTANGRTWKWTGVVWQLLPRTLTSADITDFSTAAAAASSATTDASLLASGTLADARLSSTVTTSLGKADTALQSGAAINNISGLQTALDGKQASGSYATLEGGKVPSSQLPSYVDDVIEAVNFAALPATGETGTIYVTIDSNKTYRWSGSAYVEISASPGSTDSVTEGSTNLYFTNSRAAAAAPVQSVAGRTGAVTLSSSDVGLGNCNNTSDANKPVSSAQQTALDAKQIKSVYSDTAPSHSAGLEWVDTTSMRSYRSYNGVWVEIDRA